MPVNCCVVTLESTLADYTYFYLLTQPFDDKEFIRQIQKHPHKNSAHTRLFTAAQFVKAKDPKQSKCPSAGSGYVLVNPNYGTLGSKADKEEDVILTCGDRQGLKVQGNVPVCCT